jgi:hypothetical protein
MNADQLRETLFAEPGSEERNQRCADGKAKAPIAAPRAPVTLARFTRHEIFGGSGRCAPYQ